MASQLLLVLMPFVILFFYKASVQADGFITVRLEAYYNPGGKGANGHCCDGKYGICQKNGCDPKFSICLHDSFIDSQELSETDIDCSYGQATTGTVKNQDSIDDFGELDNNPLTFIFYGSLPTQAFLLVEVWDDDIFQDDFIEALSATVNLTGVQPEQYNQLTLRGRTTLVTLVRVGCAPEWYGQKCDVLCAVPPGSNFFCTPDGEKICLPGVTGENCDQPVIPPTRRPTFPPFSPTRPPTTRPPTPRTAIVTLPTRRSPGTSPPRRTTQSPDVVCVDDCSSFPDGDYPSCFACDVYVTCSNGFIYDLRPCPFGTGWNDDLKRCDTDGTRC